MVFYVPPHKLAATLADMNDVLGPERQCCVARELTKVHETFVRGQMHEVRSIFDESGVKGEVTLIVEGSGPEDTLQQGGPITPVRKAHTLTLHMSTLHSDVCIACMLIVSMAAAICSGADIGASCTRS
jgi:16S rRNA C1402 (ribose-2'-O) methylase RsmI